MAVSFLPIILMFLGSSGGINELLDLTDPQTYLQAQAIEYRLEPLLEVLAEPATKDVEQVKAQEIKKLLVMRALGALKDRAALPALEQAAAQKTQFFKDYASAAIAAIEGETYVAPVASDAQLAADLALLPEGVGLVIQARLSAGGNLDLRKILAEALKAIPDAPKPDELLAQINSQIGKVAGKIGNVRLDAVTLGLSEDIGDSRGFVVIIGRGEYDHRALEGLLSEQPRTEHHEVGGTMFLGMDGDDVALAPVSAEQLVMVSGPTWDKFPLGEVAANLKNRPAAPVFSAGLQKVIDRADRKGAIWGAGLISAGMKAAPPLAPFDEIVLSTRELDGQNINRLKLDGVGTDAVAVADTMDQMKQMVGQGITEMEQQLQPGMEPLLKIMKSLRFYTMGLNGTVTADFDGNPANVAGIMAPLLGVTRSGIEPAPPVRQPALPPKVP